MDPLYDYPDSNAGSPLKAIPAGSARLQSWMARSVERAGFPLDREVQIAGAIGIVRGLEYHHGQFMDRVRSLEPLTAARSQSFRARNLPPRLPTPDEFRLLAECHHEAVAYINRAGQLYYFAKAMQLEGLLPQAAALLPFRNKHTAHRSIDAPRSESPDDLQQHAMAFGFGHMLVDGFPVFQICDADEWTDFNMKAAHPTLMSEAMTLFDAIFQLPDDA